MKKKILFLCVLLLSGILFSGMYDVYLKHAYTDKTTYASGDTVSLDLLVASGQNQLLPEGKLVTLLVNWQNEPVADYIIPVGMVPPGGATISTNIALPALPAGRYELRFYYSTGTIYRGGMPWYLNTEAGKASFQVAGDRIDWFSIETNQQAQGASNSIAGSSLRATDQQVDSIAISSRKPLQVVVSKEVYFNLGFGALVRNESATVAVSEGNSSIYSVALAEGQLARVKLVSGDETRVVYFAYPTSAGITNLWLENATLAKDGLTADVGASADGLAANELAISPSKINVKFGESKQVTASVLSPSGIPIGTQAITVSPDTILPSAEGSVDVGESLGKDAINLRIFTPWVVDATIRATYNDGVIANENKRVVRELAYSIPLKGDGLYQVTIQAGNGSFSYSHNVKQQPAQRVIEAPADWLNYAIVGLGLVIVMIIYMWKNIYLPGKKQGK
ncbi:hypothetical protein AUJ13_06025 [Candidatus Micrarchaeota archaeon CG1_02_49_24]|nr:MAG: hypothetical protein AUJ13_06025 [Candidatus Micrarchaeota archaeon CG1_02_49_24]